MRRRGTIRIGIIAAVLIAGFVGINRICHFLLQASDVSFSFDQVLANSQKEKIIFTVRQAGLTNPMLIAQLIKEKCAAVDHVSIMRRPNHTWHITISALKPFVAINSDWILNQKGSLVPRAQYDVVHIGSLPNICMKTHATLPSVSVAFRQWLIDLDPTLFDRYSILWNNDYDIVMTEKNNTSFSLVTTCLHRITDQSLAFCDAVKQTVAMRKTRAHTKDAWKADIRFDKQIILSGDLAGDKNG